MRERRGDRERERERGGGRRERVEVFNIHWKRVS